MFNVWWICVVVYVVGYLSLDTSRVKIRINGVQSSYSKMCSNVIVGTMNSRNLSLLSATSNFNLLLDNQYLLLRKIDSSRNGLCTHLSPSIVRLDILSLLFKQSFCPSQCIHWLGHRTINKHGLLGGSLILTQGPHMDHEWEELNSFRGRTACSHPHLCKERVWVYVHVTKTEQETTYNKKAPYLPSIFFLMIISLHELNTTSTFFESVAQVAWL